MSIKLKRIIEGMSKNAAGVVVISKDKRQVLTVWPTNQYGGYEFTFPKGRIDHGEDSRTTALREFEEETGISKSYLKLKQSLGSFAGTTTNTEYFLGELDDDDIVEKAKPPISKELGFPEIEKVEWMWIDDFKDNTTSKRDLIIINKVSSMV